MEYLYYELQTMNFLLDFLFPKRCVSCGGLGSYICKHCFSKIEFIEKPVCPICQRQAVGGKTHPGCQGRWRLDGLIVAARYSGPVKSAIAKVKYRWVYDIGKTLVNLLSSNLWRFEISNDLILVPIPLHKRRKNWRGFNQAEILAKSLSLKFNQPYGEYLARIIETASQVGLKRDERKKNVKGAFSLRPLIDPEKIKGRNFLLVDDVYTSGATMAESAKVLKKAQAKGVWGMAVALG